MSSNITRMYLLHNNIFTSQNVQCLNLNDISYLTPLSTNVYRYVGLATVLFGIIGNLLGAWCAYSQNPRARKILNCEAINMVSTNSRGSDTELFVGVRSTQQILSITFFATNTLNCLLMALWPMLDSFGDYANATFWYTKSWNVFVARIQQPLIKTFINLSFLQAFLFAADQYVAVRYPFYHRRCCRSRTLLCKILLLLLGYSALWYVPVTFWQRIVLIKTCTNNVVYGRGIFIPQNKRLAIFWKFYQVVRELMNKIIPFVAMLYFEITVLKLKRTRIAIMKSRVMTLPLVSSGNQQKAKKSSKPSIMNSPRHSLREPTVHNTIHTYTLPLNISSANKKPITQNTMSRNDRVLSFKKRENAKDLKMLIILIYEFVLLLLPVSCLQIVIRTIPRAQNALTSRKISQAEVICSLLEYFYISLTFYINFCFNHVYRVNVLITLRYFVARGIQKAKQVIA